MSIGGRKMEKNSSIKEVTIKIEGDSWKKAL